MPAKEVAAFEVNRQRKHEAAVEQEKKRNPKWPGDGFSFVFVTR
jgi:hypothetical protein